MKMKKLILIAGLFLFLAVQGLLAQRPYRVGTTSANFLEWGFGVGGSALGDAAVAMSNDLSSIYWNPAGLAWLDKNEASFLVQPWIVGIKSNFVAVGIPVASLGTLAIGLTSIDYGEMDVTTVDIPEGTGETFSASDYAISVAYGRAITSWFAFGATGKYVGSKIRHMTAGALAIDLGVQVKTFFLSPDGNRNNGLTIGMSISNYGTRMTYEGIDLLQSIDILPREDGNFKDVPGQFKLSAWELPLIFRIGVGIIPLKTEHQTLKIALDALHPNNSSEYVNSGLQYEYNVPATGKFILRAGYKALFLKDSEYGLTYGGGFEKYLMGNTKIKIDYALRDMGLFGKLSSYSLGIVF